MTLPYRNELFYKEEVTSGFQKEVPCNSAGKADFLETLLDQTHRVVRSAKAHWLSGTFKINN